MIFFFIKSNIYVVSVMRDVSVIWKLSVMSMLSVILELSVIQLLSVITVDSNSWHWETVGCAWAGNALSSVMSFAWAPSSVMSSVEMSLLISFREMSSLMSVFSVSSVAETGMLRALSLLVPGLEFLHLNKWIRKKKSFCQTPCNIGLMFMKLI